MRSRKSLLSLVLSLLYALSVVVSLTAAAQAGPSSLPPRPLPQPPASRGDGALNAEGYIKLHVLSAHAGLWTAVQWQDRDGIWRPVEGWQGTLDEIENGQGIKTWWLGKADMGTGPFRWLIYSGYQGKLLAASSPFNLPSLAGQTLQVEVSLAP